MEGSSESMEVKVARIDERVSQIHSALPVLSRQVQNHDRDILIGKVIVIGVLLFAGTKFPFIADALAKWVQ